MTSPITPYTKSDLADDDTDFFYQKNTIGQKMLTMKQVHHWHALHYMAQNVNVDSLVLENPGFEAFCKEIQTKQYSAVVISFTIKAVLKTIKMVQHLAEHHPDIDVIIGGYGTTILKDESTNSKKLLSYNPIVTHGDGVEFLERYIEKKWDIAPVEHRTQKFIPSTLNFRFLNTPLQQATSFLYSLGCNNKCSFCATAHQYGCKKIRVLSPQELYTQLKEQLEENRELKSCIIYDEDFLENRREFLEFSALVENDAEIIKRKFTFVAFASVRSIEKYTIDELVLAKIGMLFIGVESLERSILDKEQLRKRGKKSVHTLFEELHGAGINTIASTIVGWDYQTYETIKNEMDAYVTLNPTLTQILPLIAFPGTELWNTLRKENRVDPNYNFDTQVFGYSSVNYLGFTQEQVKEVVTRTGIDIIKDGGPWIFKHAVNYYAGYKKYKKSDDAVLRKQSENYRKMSFTMLPVALASILFFYGRGFQKRWMQFFIELLKESPIRTMGSFIWGIPLLTLLSILYTVNSVKYRLSKDGEQPDYGRYHYTNRVLESRK